MVLRRDVCWVHQSYLKWDKVANLANKMLENHGIAEGHVLGPVIFKMCTVDFLCAYGLTLNTTKWELFVVRKDFAN